MTNEIVISGYSDDVVSVEGPRPLSDEFGAFDRVTFLELSTGDVFRVEYTQGGVWCVDHHVVTGACAVSIEKVPEDADDPDPYTDKATVTGPIDWIEAWQSWPADPVDVREKLEERMDGIGDSDVARMWAVLRPKGAL